MSPSSPSPSKHYPHPTDLGRDAIQETVNPLLLAVPGLGPAAFAVDPAVSIPFLRQTYNLPATALDYRNQTAQMAQAGQDVSERWKDDPGLNFLVDMAVTGGVMKGAHLGVDPIFDHPLVRDLIRDETGVLRLHRAQYSPQGQWRTGHPSGALAEAAFTLVVAAIAIWSYRETLD